MQETNEVKDDVTLEESVAENLKDEQVATEEVQPAKDGEAVAEGQPKKKNGLKNFIQLVLFILLSMAGFIVQMIIEQVGEKLPPIINLNEQTFNLFGLEQAVGSFIITMIAVFVCKLINFILHRKVLFKARANLGFSIAMYLIFSIVLWIGSAAVKAPVKNALLANEWWAAHDPDGGWAVLIAVMVYSTADLIIMFFAEKFLIMNDKLFKKGKEQAAEGDGVAIEGESDVNAVSEEGAVAVAADVASDEAEAEVKEPEVASADEIVIISQNEDIATPDEEEEVKNEEETSDANVLSLEEAAEVAQKEVMQEEIKQGEQTAAEAKTAKKAPAKKTTSTAKKSTTSAAKKTTSATKSSTAKSTASKSAASTKTTSASSATAKKTATVKATATKAPAKKTTSAASAKTTSSASKSSTSAKKTTSTAKKTTSATKKSATETKTEENKD